MKSRSTETDLCEFAEKNYQFRLNNAEFWVAYAESLRTAATICRERDQLMNGDRSPPDPGSNRQINIPVSEVMLHRVVWMLEGMCLECLFKGLWMHQTSQDKENPEDFPRTWNNHDLAAMATELTARGYVKFGDKERQFISRLSPFIVAGRYPVGRKPGDRTDMGNKLRPDGRFTCPPTPALVGDEPLFNQIADKVIGTLPKFRT
jgi:hypothetical protein